MLILILLANYESIDTKEKGLFNLENKYVLEINT